MRFALLTQKLTEFEPGYKPVFVIAGLTAVGSVIRVAFNIGYNIRAFEDSEQVHRTCCVNFEESFLIPLTLGLILTAGCLLARNAVARILSMSGLFLAATVYLLWFRGTLSIIRKAEVASFSALGDQAQYLLPLQGATWWDVAVLAIVILLIGWHIGISLSLLKRLTIHRLYRRW